MTIPGTPKECEKTESLLMHELPDFVRVRKSLDISKLYLATKSNDRVVINALTAHGVTLSQKTGWLFFKMM